LVPIFVQKYQVGPPIFLSLNLIPIFEKIMQFCSFFVKFIELDQCFFIKIEVVNKDGLLC